MTIPNQPALAEHPEPPRSCGAAIFEAWLAIATLTLWPLCGQRTHASTDDRGRAMVFVPLVGFALGVAAALVDHATATLGNRLVRSVLVMLLLTAATKALHPIGLARTVAALRASGPQSSVQPNAGGWLAAILLIALELACLAAITNPAARAQAIVLATMLSRWAIVPIGYGLRPLDPSGLGVPYEGGIKFREFAIGSVLALGIAMGLYDIVALAAIVVLALTILSMRLLFIRRLGGAPGYALAGGAAICELVVLATLAALRI